ncbi:MAG: HDOD domain-containing protein [Desulfobacterales bacterium]|nr:MAG: HDOD domain-containing protein [Desulfobacterales bacterium]
MIPETQAEHLNAETEGMQVFVARQPIFDGHKHLYGYELLFRDGMTNAFPDIDGETATSRLLANSFFSIGIDRLGSGKNIFINFPQELLLKRYPTLFPKDSLIVEILEDVEPEAPVVNACREMGAEGYRIALDDFLFRTELQPLIDIADIIKIDFRCTPLDEMGALLENVSGGSLKLLAEKIETYEEFETARDLGFVYFQGYFFSKPEIVQSRDIAPSKINLIQIMAEVNKPDVSFEELEKLITRDVSMSYKLLRYINSAYFRRVQEIASIRHAIVILGMQEIQKFISLMAATELAMDKPTELIRTSIIRARFLELMGASLGSAETKSELFLLGLFSLIDAMLDNRMDRIMKNLPLPAKIKAALTEGRGELTGFLHLVVGYESGDWNACSLWASRTGIEEKKLPALYLEAVQWTQAFLGK